MELTLQQRLRKFINDTGLSDKEFAERIGCSKQELSNWLHGTKIGLNRIVKISEVWPEFDVGWFITGKESGSENNKEHKKKAINDNSDNAGEVIDLYKALSEHQKTIIELQSEKIEWLIKNQKD